RFHRAAPAAGRRQTVRARVDAAARGVGDRLHPAGVGWPMSHRIGPELLSVERAEREVAGTDCGAIVHFVGTVRDHTRGKAVVALEYEAYAEMALEVFARLEAEARAQWPGVR